MTWPHTHKHRLPCLHVGRGPRLPLSPFLPTFSAASRPASGLQGFTAQHPVAGSIPGLGRSPREGKRLPTPVFWPGEFRGLWSPWGCRATLTFGSPPVKDERQTAPEGPHRYRPLCSVPHQETPAQLLQVCRLRSLGIPFESYAHHEASLTFLNSRGLGPHRE